MTAHKVVPADSIIDVMAKRLCPQDYPNWHTYREWARDILKDMGQQSLDERFIWGVNEALAEPDREITHAELNEGRLRLHCRCQRRQVD